MDDDDDMPQLPADTLQLLQQFITEKDEQDKAFENLKTKAEERFENGSTKLSMALFGEDWNASQFWYTDATARTLAYQLLDGVTADSAIAVVSAPSVYIQLREILSESDVKIKPKLCLLEFDNRFDVVGTDFLFYDFQHPLRLPPELKAKFDRIICDPPFLSEDCQSKTALTVRYLSRTWASGTLKLISCTGERMESLMAKLYGKIGMLTTTFEPQHSKGLSNEFFCYANFECNDWTWRQPQGHASFPGAKGGGRMLTEAGTAPGISCSGRNSLDILQDNVSHSGTQHYCNSNDLCRPAPPPDGAIMQGCWLWNIARVDGTELCTAGTPNAVQYLHRSSVFLDLGISASARHVRQTDVPAACDVRESRPVSRKETTTLLRQM
ncbi:Protein-lysine N-methyltransferase efm5 [Saxophila tyrrhenica]|uniref:Protein-lysine N-methyltransferase EFM5 n=1 Tax=Saxophila tyrrhenica TaxID=1690608 RepID=A0AAV9PKH1_9PEZI|nr:Protein-lysine N-methyltransferase efm5 [Saxophila tyrrhenica]